MKNFRTIIIADPERHNQVIVRAILEECIAYDNIYKCGTIEKVLYSVNECLINNKQLPSLVLLNAYLSEKESFSVFEKVIGHPYYSDTTTQLVVIVNNYISQQQREVYKENGIRILEKPLTLDKMKRVLGVSNDGN